MRFDSMDYEDMTAKDMFKAVKEKLNPTGRTYLFLDEVQEIERLGESSKLPGNGL